VQGANPVTLVAQEMQGFGFKIQGVTGFTIAMGGGQSGPNGVASIE